MNISDGTFYPSHHIGACGWIVATPDLQQWIQGGCVVPGKPSIHSAYRAELCGLAGIAFFFNSIILPINASFHQSVFSDCKSALKRITTSPEYVKSSTKHMDLISLITHLWSTCPVTPLPQYVKAHQDKNPHTILSAEAQLNCHMDNFAKQIALRAILHSNLSTPSFHSSLGFGSILCNNTYIHSHLQRELYSSVTHNNFIKYLSSHLEVPIDDLTSKVNWDCPRLSRSSSRFGLVKFISKFLASDIACSKVMHKRKQRLLPNCPLCGAQEQDNIHLLRCPSASTFRFSLITQLQSWLYLQQTDPSLTTFIIDGLLRWFLNPTAYNFSQSSDPILHNAFSSQTCLGWYSLLCGYISTDLVHAQSCFYIESGSCRSSTKWGSQLILQCWNIIYQLWTNRNNILHNNSELQILHGLPLLKEAIASEYSAGISNLPSVYRRYFSIPIPLLLQKSNLYLKRWFLVIRSGRESLHPLQYNDIWWSNKALRKWIGLPPSSPI